jgi:hypothetical protein
MCAALFSPGIALEGEGPPLKWEAFMLLIIRPRGRYPRPNSRSNWAWLRWIIVGRPCGQVRGMAVCSS